MRSGTLLGKLAGQVHANGFVRGGARHDQAARDRNQQRRDHGHQAIAHGENRVGFQRVLERNVELEDADQKSGEDIDGGDQNGGQRVALAEARRAVHRAVEFRFLGDHFAARAGLLLVDQPGVQVRVDGHLLAGHGVQGEARGDFRGAHRAVVDHQILNRDQRDEDDEADHVIAAHDELPERCDHAAGRGRAFVSVQQNPAAAGDVQRNAEQA